MMKKTISFVAALALTTGVMAGGDDRDSGPVEPIFDKVVVNEQNPETMKLTDTSKPAEAEPVVKEVIGATPAGVPVTKAAHIACKDKLGLSDDNIARFMEALAGGFVYNTGPIDAFGTLFSPERWADYYTCVEEFK